MLSTPGTCEGKFIIMNLYVPIIIPGFPDMSRKNKAIHNSLQQTSGDRIMEAKVLTSVPRTL